MCKLLYGVAILVILLSVSCGKKNIEILDAPIIHLWEPDARFSSNFAMTAINAYKDAIVYPTFGEKDYVFVFEDLSGKRIKDIAIKAGKGPGEMQSHMAISIMNDTIYIYDYILNKIIAYTTSGQYIDDYIVDESIAAPMTVAVDGENMYINGKYDNKLIKYDLQKNAVVKGLKYGSGNQKIPENGDVFEGGWLAYDPADKLIYLGFYNRPYRLERYDRDLNLKDTFVINDATDYKECTWYYASPVAVTQVGDRVIAGIVFDENYVYTTYGGGYDVTINDQDKPYEYRPSSVKIQVFDKKKGELVSQIGCSQLEGIRGFVKILGVNKESIMVQIADMSEVTYKIMGKQRAEKQNRNFAIAVLKNPMYATESWKK